MKKPFIIGLALALATGAFAQSSVNVDTFVTHNLSNRGADYSFNHNDWRGGLYFPVLHRDRLKLGPAVATDTTRGGALYFGAVASYNLLSPKSAWSFGPSVSWTANVSNFRHFSQAEWGVGVALGYRF